MNVRGFMKKIIGFVSFFFALAGAFMTVISCTVIDNYILFFIGIGAFALGFVGSLFSGKEIKEAVVRMLDFM